MNVAGALSELVSKTSYARADADLVAACPDLVSVGSVGAAIRARARGPRVTYGRVTVVEAGRVPAHTGESGEVRVVGRPASLDEAAAWTSAAAGIAAGRVVTGFALADLVVFAGGDHMALADVARTLRAAGLDGVAEVQIDRLPESDEDAAEMVRAVQHGGLLAKRATIERALFADRLHLIERAAALQAATQAFAAFAPLPRVDPVDAPSTGYDDVKTIVMARMLAAAIPSVQVDWVLYGPKLAQVAIEYGADDIDGVADADIEKLGVRRSPKVDIERQICSAFAEPIERTGRYEMLA